MDELNNFEMITKDIKKLSEFLFHLIHDFSPIEMNIKNLSEIELEQYLKKTNNQRQQKNLNQVDFNTFLLWWKNREIVKPEITKKRFIECYNQCQFLMNHNFNANYNSIVCFFTHLINVDDKKIKNISKFVLNKIYKYSYIIDINTNICNDIICTKKVIDDYCIINKELLNIISEDVEYKENIERRKMECEYNIELLNNKIKILNIINLKFGRLI